MTPPSTGGVEETSLVSALPSLAVTARISHQLHAHVLALAADNVIAPATTTAAVALRRGRAGVHVEAGLYAGGEAIMYGHIAVPEYDAAKEQAQDAGSYIGSTLRWIVWGDWSVSSWLWRSA